MIALEVRAGGVILPFSENFRGFGREKWRIGGNVAENAGLPLRKRIK